MEHFFELPVQYKGEGRKFSGRLVTFAYEYKCYIVVDGKEIVFKRDDEMNYALVRETAEAVSDPELLHAIVVAINQLNRINDFQLHTAPAYAA